LSSASLDIMFTFTYIIPIGLPSLQLKVIWQSRT